MTSAYFTIGSKCNHSCIFCPCRWEKRGEEIELPVFQEMLQKIEDNDRIDSVILSGGEPTVQDNFFDLLRCVSHTRLRVRLLTNADRLSDPDMTVRIREVISPSQMDIVTALHSDDSRIHERITGSAGSFARTNKGLHNMLREGYQVNVKFCISRLNYRSMGSFVDFIYDTFPDSVSLSLCSIDYCGRADDNHAAVAVSFDEMKEYLEQALEKVEGYESRGRKRNVIVTNTPLCCVNPIYWKYCISDSKRDMEAFLPLPSEGKGGLKYHSPSGSGTFFKACKQCEVERYCAGAWYSACQILGEDSVKPVRIRQRKP